MGCDIHLRVEYRAPGETVALVDGEITVVPAEKLEASARSKCDDDQTSVRIVYWFDN